MLTHSAFEGESRSVLLGEAQGVFPERVGELCGRCTPLTFLLLS